MKMNKEKIKNYFAKAIASTLNIELYIEANSTSCIVIYQPKAPVSLSRYRKIK